ncbi:MAG: DUF433 domain-containing protein [Acidobacteriota bacterium]|nr:DUF433 domain-containing protein [Acidobacteriota bacterium]
MNAIEALRILDFDDDEPVAEFRMTGQPRTDRREIPRYTVAEVSLYLHIKESTLRSWIFGRPYPANGTIVQSGPLMEPADPGHGRLSFYNLVEAHILRTTRQQDEVPMPAIREALRYANARNAGPHPLITQQFETEGSSLFVSKLGELVNYTKQGQQAFADLMQEHLQRIDRDTLGPYALYPIIPNKPKSKVVTIKPGVSSGVPTVAGTGISISILFARYHAGDSIDDLIDDYGLSREQVEDSIEYIRAA